jgi:nucleoside-diphosphate-sugar epimerase
MEGHRHGDNPLTKTIFLAGATGAIGRRLSPILVAEGWRVVGATRSEGKLADLRALGVEPVIADVFDAAMLTAAVVAAKPDVVIHQLTDLSAVLDPIRMPNALVGNARIRDEGTRNLLAAALAAGARRFIAQSIAFAYAEGPLPHKEEDPLALTAGGVAGISVRGVASLESQALAAPLDALVLRYGFLYGPGTGFDTPEGPAPLHVDAAAKAAALAVTRGAPGLYNIAEDNDTVTSDKAKRKLGWSADWRGGS